MGDRDEHTNSQRSWGSHQAGADGSWSFTIYISAKSRRHQPKISEVEKGAPSVRVGLVLQILRALDLVVTIEKDEPATPRRHRWPSDEVDLDKIANTGLD